MFGLKPWPHAAVAGYALTPSLLSQDSRVVPLVTAHTLRQYHAPVNAPFIGLSAPHQLLSASHQCHETDTTRQTESRMELIVVRIESVKICD